MQFLPDELMLKIVGYLPLPDVCSLASTRKRYRSLCSDLYVWKGLFAKKGLLMLEIAISFSSWLGVYYKTLIGKRGAKYVLSLHSKNHKRQMEVIEPVLLHDLPPCVYRSILDCFPKGFKGGMGREYLSLSKGKEFLCCVENEEGQVLKDKIIDKKQAYEILYRLFYCGKCRIVDGCKV